MGSAVKFWDLEPGYEPTNTTIELHGVRYTWVRHTNGMIESAYHWYYLRTPGTLTLFRAVKPASSTYWTWNTRVRLIDPYKTVGEGREITRVSAYQVLAEQLMAMPESLVLWGAP